MTTPPHIQNLKRASDEAWRKYEQAIDDPAIERDMLNEMGLAAEILTSIYHHEYDDPLNWLEAVEMPVTNIVQQPADIV